MIERFEIDTVNRHTITSNVTLCCAETGRVIAVFYNDYDAEALLAAAPRPEAGQQTSFAMDALLRKLVDAWNSGWHCNGDDNLKTFESSMSELSSLVAATPKTEPRPVPTSECQTCNGSGHAQDQSGEACTTCFGSGVRPAEPDGGEM